MRVYRKALANSEANWHLLFYAILSYNDYDDTEEKQSVTVWNKYKQYVCDEANRNIPGVFANIFYVIARKSQKQIMVTILNKKEIIIERRLVRQDNKRPKSGGWSIKVNGNITEVHATLNT